MNREPLDSGANRSTGADCTAFSTAVIERQKCLSFQEVEWVSARGGWNPLEQFPPPGSPSRPEGSWLRVANPLTFFENR